MATNKKSKVNMGGELLLATLVVAVLILPVCAVAGEGNGQYFARRDTIALGTGDAPQTNIVTHTIDPWPWYARNDRLRFDGDRILLGIGRYKVNRSIEPHGLSTQTIMNDQGSGRPPPGGPPASR